MQKLRQVVEDSNTDYALTKREFYPNLAEHTLQAWRSLSSEQQQQAQQDKQQCRELLLEKLMLNNAG